MLAAVLLVAPGAAVIFAHAFVEDTFEWYERRVVPIGVYVCAVAGSLIGFFAVAWGCS